MRLNFRDIPGKLCTGVDMIVSNTKFHSSIADNLCCTDTAWDMEIIWVNGNGKPRKFRMQTRRGYGSTRVMCMLTNVTYLNHGRVGRNN